MDYYSYIFSYTTLSYYVLVTKELKRVTGNSTSHLKLKEVTGNSREPLKTQGYLGELLGT